MGLINNGWYGMFVACGIGCLADVCFDEGLMLETSAKHHIPQATNIPYQPLLIKPIYRRSLTVTAQCSWVLPLFHFHLASNAATCCIGG